METLQESGYYVNHNNSSIEWNPGYPAPEYVCGYDMSGASGSHISLPVLTSLTDMFTGKAPMSGWYQCGHDDVTQYSPGGTTRELYYHQNHAYHHKYHPDHLGNHHTTIARRNERERNRVKNINSTFTKLRQHLPCSSKNKKLSKVQILRSAIQYINQLQHVLDSQELSEKEQSPLSLTRGDSPAGVAPHSDSKTVPGEDLARSGGGTPELPGYCSESSARSVTSLSASSSPTFDQDSEMTEDFSEWISS